MQCRESTVDGDGPGVWTLPDPGAIVARVWQGPPGWGIRRPAGKLESA